MGLIKAGIGALGGTLADQWKEYFYCDSLDRDTLMIKGQKRTSKRSSNTKGSDNIISNGSVIAVADGQCMIILEQGKVVEFCAEPGEFVYDTSTEPSLFAGKLGTSIKETFKTIGKRFTFGGDTGKDQRVYYFNTKKIPDNKYGTSTPIPFRVIVDETLGYKLSVDLRCNGQYVFHLEDPLLFYKEYAGNVTDCYKRSELEGQMKGDLLSALQPALAKIAARKIAYYEIPGHTEEITEALQTELRQKWLLDRGIMIDSCTVNSVSIPDDQRKKITEWEETAMTTNLATAAARTVGAQADTMRTAASNPNGAMMGFMGMGMAQQAGGMNAQNLFSMAMQQQQQQAAAAPVAAAPAPAANGWKCSCGATATGKFCPECGSKKPEPKPVDSWTCKCGNVATGKFCPECGSPKPVVEGWTCRCGAVNKGKFCPQCGSPKPAAAPLYKCDKCGWEPADPRNPPKFCPECGDIFDDRDAH